MSLTKQDKQDLAQAYQNIFNAVKVLQINTTVTDSGRFKYTAKGGFVEHSMTTSDVIKGLLIFSERIQSGDAEVIRRAVDKAIDTLPV